jgi:hypothetical protein
MDSDHLLRHHWWPAARSPDKYTVTAGDPQGAHEDVMRAMHDDVLAGHLGEKHTLDHAQLHYWWPGILGRERGLSLRRGGGVPTWRAPDPTLSSWAR